MSLEIVLRDGRALDEQAVKVALDLAVENGAVDELFTAAVRADAQRLYEEGRGLREAARAMSRLVIECNAAIGQVLLDRRGEALVIGGREISDRTRCYWRVLGASRERGRLGERLAAVGDEPTTVLVAKAARIAGDFNVLTKDLAEMCAPAIDSRVRAWEASPKRRRGPRPGMTTLRREAGVHTNLASASLSWPTARRVLRVAGIDLTVPASAPRPGSGRRTSKWLTHRRRLTGGRWDESYSRLRLLLDAVQEVAPNANPRYDAIYAHLYEIESFLGAQLRKSAP